jgi:monoamine oxidase
MKQDPHIEAFRVKRLEDIEVPCGIEHRNTKVPVTSDTHPRELLPVHHNNADVLTCAFPLETLESSDSPTISKEF